MTNNNHETVDFKIRITEMRIYNGWKFTHEGVKYTVDGSIKLRGNQYYLLVRDDGTRSSIHRSVLLKWFNEKRILFI